MGHMYTHSWSLGQENSLEKGMATLSSTIAWRISWAEEPGGLKCLDSQRVRHDLGLEWEQEQRWFTLLLGRDWPNIIKQLHFSKN